MLLLKQAISSKDLILQAFILGSVIVSYSFLLNAASSVPPSLWPTLMPRLFTHIAVPTDGCPTDPVNGYLAEFEDLDRCQLNVDQFAVFCSILNAQLSYAEVTLLFHTLDVSANGYLSWGELSIDYFNYGNGAYIFYIDRWRRMKSQTGGGLSRIDWINYGNYSHYGNI